MLQITVPRTEYYDEANNQFIYKDEETLRLEHSLVSLSKWEAKHQKAFLSKRDMTEEETLDYVRCMTINKNVDPDIYYRLSRENIEEINAYISAPMTATTFHEDKNGRTSREVITSELIYYWMIALNIPFECQKWHLNRLLTLVRVCNIKNAPPKKMGKGDLMRRNAQLNAARRKKLRTKG